MRPWSTSGHDASSQEPGGSGGRCGGDGGATTQPHSQMTSLESRCNSADLSRRGTCIALLVPRARARPPNGLAVGAASPVLHEVVHLRRRGGGAKCHFQRGLVLCCYWSSGTSVEGAGDASDAQVPFCAQRQRRWVHGKGEVGQGRRRGGAIRMWQMGPASQAGHYSGAED